jgi:hypothetical protein
MTASAQMNAFFASVGEPLGVPVDYVKLLSVPVRYLAPL